MDSFVLEYLNGTFSFKPQTFTPTHSTILCLCFALLAQQRSTVDSGKQSNQK